MLKDFFKRKKREKTLDEYRNELINSALSPSEIAEIRAMFSRQE